MMKNTLRIGIIIFNILLVVSLISCKGKDEGGNVEGNGKNKETISGNVNGKGRATEWEELTSQVMKLYSSGDYEQGVKVAKRALQVAQENDGPDHPNVALSLGNLAELYEAQKEYAKAEPLYKRSVKILEKAYGQDSQFLVPTLLNMASLYNNTGRENEAQKMMERANNIQAKQ